MAPTPTGKPGKMGERFPLGEKSGNFTHNIGKIKDLYTNTGKVKEF